MFFLKTSSAFFHNPAFSGNCCVGPKVIPKEVDITSSCMLGASLPKAPSTSLASASIAKSLFHYCYYLCLLVVLFLSGCTTFHESYDQPAYKPHKPSQVVVKVSLQKQMIYVMEGKRPLLITACCVGIPSKPTPKGNFEVTRKERNKRSQSYGFSILHNTIAPVEAGHGLGHYIGYPMPYWVEFLPGYGFHQGWVWPIPRSHGCIRIHANDAGKFYELVRIGTPIKIATTQAEDATLGAKLRRPRDYNSPDQPAALLVSPGYFLGLKKIIFKNDG